MHGRGWRAVAAVIGWFLLAAAAPAGAPADPEVVPARGVDQLFALGRVALYHGDRGWRRVLDGRDAPARRVPPDAWASSIGRDRVGRIVVTFQHWPRGRVPARPHPARPRWWAYDVAGDAARPLRIPARRMCFAGDVAVWRGRTAFSESCWRRFGDQASGPTWGFLGRDVALDDGSQVRRAHVGPFTDTDLALRGRSLAVVARHGDNGVWRIADDGRWCPRRLAGLFYEVGYVASIAIRHGSVEWGTADQRWVPADPPYRHMLLAGVPLAGRCEAAPPVRLFDPALTDIRMQAAAIDRDALLYATERGIFRRRVPPAGTTAPPPNDDVERAIPVGGPLPVEVVGRTGYATAQPGEPLLAGVPEQSVWYAFTAPSTETVYVDAGLLWSVGLFEGSTLPALAPLPAREPLGEECAPAFAVRAGQTYLLAVATWGTDGAGVPRAFALRIADVPGGPSCA